MFAAEKRGGQDIRAMSKLGKMAVLLSASLEDVAPAPPQGRASNNALRNSGSCFGDAWQL